MNLSDIVDTVIASDFTNSPQKYESSVSNNLYPTAIIQSETINEVYGWIKFDASKSKDMNGELCTAFMFNFGDGSPPIVISSPVVTRPFLKSGIYNVSVTVMDKNGLHSQAYIQQRIEMPSSSNHSLHDNIVKRKNPTYDPPSTIRARGNIRIPRAITEKVIPSKIDVKCFSNLYSYLDKLTALQWNEQDDHKYDIGDKKVLDYDFHDKQTGESLYCLIKRIDETVPTSKNYKWIMDKALYNQSELMEIDFEKNMIQALRTEKYTMSLWKNKYNLDDKIKEKLQQKINTISLNKIKIYNKYKLKQGNEAMI